MDICVALTGMPGSGKSNLATQLVRRGYFHISMSEQLKVFASTIPSTEERWALSHSLRSTHGPAFLAEEALKRVPPDASKVVVDGVRTFSEVALLSEAAATFQLIALQRSPEARYIRLRSAGDAYYKTQSDAVIKLDAHELTLGTANLIALADYIYFTDEQDPACLRNLSHMRLSLWTNVQSWPRIVMRKDPRLRRIGLIMRHFKHSSNHEGDRKLLSRLAHQLTERGATVTIIRRGHLANFPFSNDLPWDTIVHSSRSAITLQLLAAWEALGVTVVNGPASVNCVLNRPALFSLMRAEGIPSPPTGWGPITTIRDALQSIPKPAWSSANIALL